MNHFSIGAMPYGSGYIGWTRKPHKADNEVIKAKGGKPQLFPTSDAAKAAAGQCMVDWLNGHMVRDGERLCEAKANANSFFKDIGK